MGKGGYNKCVFVSAKNPFIKPQICSNYSLYYFEIKCIIEGELNNVDKFMNRIGIRNSSTTEGFIANEDVTKYVRYSAKFATHFNEQEENATNFNNNDIFGFGLVYPPNNKMKKEFPYIFFTKNGEQINNCELVEHNSLSYKPYVWLKCCSIEANFGNDLESKPFKYDISKHLVLKEFDDFY
uniref:Uncharacterized protein n=1 Tax=Meloidogyne enterolobii TaxID=390850 RepID=A0A6V7XDV5_MELEN|nr:unnamed protein product [Meloidogyne enterolobii]